MANYKETQSPFVNPYNFVSLESQPDRENLSIYKEGELLRGKISCRIDLLTPIFIPNTSVSHNDETKQILAQRFEQSANDGNKLLKNYEFYSYEDLNGADPKRYGPEKPVIPGSEIRGIIRSAFEAVSNSCMSTIDDKHTLYKRTTDVGQPGRIIKGANNEYSIVPCDVYGVAIRPTKYDHNDFSSLVKELKEGQLVYFKKGGFYKKYLKKQDREINIYPIVSDIKTQKEPGLNIEGYFHHGEPFGKRKHHERVFVPNGDTPIKLNSRAITNYLTNCKLYADKKINIAMRPKSGPPHKGYKNLKELNKNNLDGQLVYFRDIDGQYYLSPAMIGREVFHNTLKGLIGEYSPCVSSQNLCPACALFGFVSDNESDNILGGRVRFTDAILTGRVEYDSPGVLKELASPKTSSTEFYMRKPNQKAVLWNYDYWLDMQRNTHKNPNQLLLRGRKFYWHQKNPTDYFERNPSNYNADRHIAVRPLKKGSFEFDVFFDGITQEELSRLTYTLEIGAKSGHAHKIGMGKPLGLGSVKVTVNQVLIRQLTSIANSIDYTVSDAIRKIRDEYTVIANQVESIAKDFLIMTDFDNAPANIQYPKVVNENNQEGPVYEWFSANRTGKDGASGTKQEIWQTLKTPEEIQGGDQNKKYQKFPSKNPGYGGGGGQQRRYNNNNNYRNNRNRR
jgi:CRISPR-associated protein (TIGR03986 family)